MEFYQVKFCFNLTPLEAAILIYAYPTLPDL